MNHRIHFGLKKFPALLPLIAGAGLFTLALTGCASAPTLRGVSAKEAKIEVFRDGRTLVHGDPVPLTQLADAVRATDTHPEDTVYIRVHGSSDDEHFRDLCRRISAQMILAGHPGFRIVSTPVATVSTYDRTSGKTTAYTEQRDSAYMTDAEKKADANRLIDETKAFRHGSYVSNAAEGKRPVRISNGRPEALDTTPDRLGDPAAVPGKPAEAEDRDAALREAYRRQQRGARRK